MPASRLSSSPTPVVRSDAVGKDGRVPRFVRHVALAAREYRSIVAGDTILVNHMNPPLMRNGDLAVHVVGSASLNDDELKSMELFLREHLQQREAESRRRYARYVVLPHADWLQEDDELPIRRFSCAGFVIEAYWEAGIQLIDLDGLPEVSLDDLFVVYPELERVEENPTLRERAGALSREELGLRGGGPWPVVLPGYIFHALNRDPGEIRDEPYCPRRGDGSFPST